MILRELGPPPDLPSATARIPGIVVRVLLAIIGGLLSLLVYRASGWLAVGILLALLAAWVPEYLLGWLLIVFLAAGQLAHHAALSWQLLALVAGVHLLHLLATLALAVPYRSWVEPAVFRRVLSRFIAVQIPVQLLAVVALLLIAPDANGHRPLTIAEFTVPGAAALAGLGLLLLRRPAE